MDAALRMVTMGNAPLPSASPSRRSLSLAPAPILLALNYSVDWLRWAKTGAGGFVEFVPQLYTRDASEFEWHLDATIAELPASTVLLSGVRVEGTGEPTQWREVDRMLTVAKDRRVGVGVWYMAGVLDRYNGQFRERWAGG